MVKVLVIPDVHLKPRMFQRAAELMKNKEADRVVCLMDIPDDWNQEYNLQLYMDTFDAAIAFAAEYPDTLWCYGNHDVCYLWDQRESGYSFSAAYLVRRKLNDLKESLQDESQMAFIHRIDNVVFMHGGLTDDFVRSTVRTKLYNDVDTVIETINSFGVNEMWWDTSPLWLRPQYRTYRMYKPRKLIQVVGHTPVEAITKKGNLISCDVFSTYSTGKPIGTQEFLLIDTVSGEYEGISGLTEQ